MDKRQLRDRMLCLGQMMQSRDKGRPQASGSTSQCMDNRFKIRRTVHGQKDSYRTECFV